MPARAIGSRIALDDRERQLEDVGQRKTAGAYYTPVDVVERLLDKVLDPVLAACAGDAAALAHVRVLDPACGTGNFLLGAAERIAGALQRAGWTAVDARRAAFGLCVVGVDIDDEAIAMCGDRLSRAGGLSSGPAPQVTCADTLTQPIALDTLPNGGFDVVVGNPPFLSQLAKQTSRAGEASTALRARFGDVIGGYTDPAAIFLLLAAQLARPDGGHVAMIQPLSFLGARDAAPIRSALLESAGLTGMWIAEEQLFDATVDVCAPVLVRGVAHTSTMVWKGRSFAEVDACTAPSASDATWSPLLATAAGVPDIAVADSGRTLADEARCTADFRDQYYGLANHIADVAEADDLELPPLITAGLIDPARNYWGERPTRFNKRTYQHPRVVVADVHPSLREWARRRQVPKLLVATQTKVMEVWVDEAGTALPSVPIVTVEAPADRLWHIAAALSSPPVTLIATRRHIGTGLNAGALKLSAKNVAALPLPQPCDAWDRAAELWRAASSSQVAAPEALLDQAAVEMCAAFRIADTEDLLGWWRRRAYARRAN